MKKMLIVSLTLICLSVLAEGANEPAALTQARKAYQAQVNSALAPIKKKYIAQLEELKKQLGGKGDLEGATAVQKEIVFIKSISAGGTGNDAEDEDAEDETPQEKPRTKSGKATPSRYVSLIDLKPELARVGWASLIVGKDIKGDMDPNAGCRPFIDNELVMEDFIYAPSASHVRYAMPKKMKYFSAKIGTNNAGKPGVTFKVIVDGNEIFNSEPMPSWDKNVKDILVELPEKSKKIDLVIEQPGGGNACATYWAFPRFYAAKPNDK